MLDNLKCKIGLHKPAQHHQTFKYECRTTNKGRSKKRWMTVAKEIVTVTYCERCGKTLSTKQRWRWR
jgi:predicted SprT family Zn-dependent metalloprotease